MNNKNDEKLIDKIIGIFKNLSFLFLIFSLGFCFKKIDIYWTSIENSHNVQSISLYKAGSNTISGMFLATNDLFIDPIKNGQLNIDYLINILSEPAVFDNFNRDYDTTPVYQKSGTVRIPVFVYHHIGPNPESYGEKINNVTPQMFRDQMDYLSRKKYKVLSMYEFFDQLQKGVNPIQKSVLLTFDDGYQDFYDNAYPILKEYKFQATVFIPYNKKEISDVELLEISNNGIDVQSHTMSHTSLSRQRSTITLDFELNKSKQKLAEISSKDTFAFAYPYCVHNPTNFDYVKNSQYRLAFQCGNTKGNSIDHTYTDRFDIHRTWAYNNLQSFIDRLSGIEYRPSDLGPNEMVNKKLKML